ncbi:unnamed protein product [Pleuronectes platessa]|uniref:Uncharacterized protein n=1 Tax=Pleuronectes platessa TaxID=8262 RepID=A0A9N7YAC9_PLEPL|nr:unnamed protein product [Pleuronectes platessa]
MACPVTPHMSLRHGVRLVPQLSSTVEQHVVCSGAVGLGCRDLKLKHVRFRWVLVRLRWVRRLLVQWWRVQVLEVQLLQGAQRFRRLRLFQRPVFGRTESLVRVEKRGHKQVAIGKVFFANVDAVWSCTAGRAGTG